MKKIGILLLLSTTATQSGAQKKSEWKNLNQTEHIVRTLAADEMGGRLVFTEGINRAAVFIADEFRKAGLQPWNGKSFFQTFSVNQLQFVSVNAVLNGKPIDEKNVFAYTERELLQTNDQSSDYEPAYISKTDTFFVSLGRLRRKQKKNLLVFVDTTHKMVFNIYTSLSRKTYSGLPELNSYYYSDKDAIIILTDKKPENWSVEYRQRVEKKELKNVVGVLPGKKFSNDRVVFSAHYDHLGIRKPNNEGDSIFNGANDDASGVAAIIQLAYHFSKKNSNERSLIFSAFTFEEGGGFGAAYFNRQYEAASIIADFNIEMIGSVSEKGVGAADITGYEHSDFGKILQKKLEGSSYKFYPDTLKRMNLFFQSDNIQLAKKGIPAHTISTSRGFKEPYWHTQDDEWERVDYKNMNEVIRAIALSAGGIISGKDTPTRIDVNMFRYPD